MPDVEDLVDHAAICLVVWGIEAGRNKVIFLAGLLREDDNLGRESVGVAKDFLNRLGASHDPVPAIARSPHYPRNIGCLKAHDCLLIALVHAFQIEQIYIEDPIPRDVCRNIPGGCDGGTQGTHGSLLCFAERVVCRMRHNSADLAALYLSQSTAHVPIFRDRI